MKSSLAGKIFVYFAIVIALTSSIIGVTLYQQSSKELDRQTEKLLTQIVDNAMHHTDLYLKNYERATLSALSSSSVKEFLDTNDKSFYSMFTLPSQIKEKVIQPIFINNPEISLMYLVGYNGSSVFDVNAPSLTVNDAVLSDSLDDLKEMTKDDGSLTIMDWSFTNGNLALARKISGRQTSKAFKGILGVELKIEELTTLWKGIKLGDTGYFYIVNDRGRIVYHPSSSKIGKQLEGELYTQLQDNANRFFIDKKSGRANFSRRSDYSGWTLVASLPVNELRKPILNIRQTTLITCAFALIVALILAYRFGQTIIRPIRRLENGMRQTEKGNWTQVPMTGDKDEMDRLIRSYNVMVARLADLVDQVYAAELKNQEHLLKRQVAEFQALQLQINPHFLYNTLETVICYAVVQDSNEIKDIVRSLSYMLRYSVRADLEEITVASELKHVLHFMTIMNYRFEREFELQVDIPPEYLLKTMVRLSLQPLVENAFKHAFPDGIEEHHYVRIGMTADNGDLFVTITDNGIGIPEERLKELEKRLLLERPPERSGGEEQGGIGLLNVHNRIRMVFGDRYGVTVRGAAGAGTTVTLHMPDKRPAHILQPALPADDGGKNGRPTRPLEASTG
ncbi:histidine kinase [Paenibacillus doosanensis]|uniref:histidine kinase n=1 Tax=Paenibacillus konkukensis TaxID=2020716 RepID=A0ABY4RYE2_9BACL|nr:MULTISPECIES: sensor histidine kinase [Paenibacillus]MCS7458682.1 histidine kinase [Paenibacillus doosanensis]UQZ86795.1 Sensor histidine kinase YehU [Paenibacillus konkukensis]